MTFRICSAQNLIVNPGFETATIGIPSGTSLPPYPTFLNDWSATNTDGEFIFDLTLAHSGTGFLSVLQNAGGSPQSFWLGAPFLSGGYDRAIQIVPVTPSTTYQLQFWVRSGNSLRYPSYSSGFLLVQVEQVTPSNISIDSFTVYTPLTWQQMTYNFTTGNASTSIAILFSCYDAGNVDAWVDDLVLRETKSSNINSNNLTSDISVFPNPGIDNLNITNYTNEPSEIILYDFALRLVLQKSFINSISLNIDQLTKGIYYYEVRNKNGSIQNGKVVKD